MSQDLGSDTFARTVADTATDAFDRSVSSGWGTADLGGAWTTGGGVAGDYSVASGVGAMSMSVVNSTRRTTLALSLFEQEATVTVSCPAVATGAQISTGLMLAYVDSSNYYQADILWGLAGALGVRAVSRVGGVGTTLQSAVVGTYSAGQTAHIRAAIIAGRIYARAWLDVYDEPADWQVSGPATTITAAGRTGLRSNLDAGNTNGHPVVLSYASPNVKAIAQGWGQSWSEVGGVAGDYGVVDGSGYHGLSTVNASRRTLLGLDVADSDITCTVRCPVIALTADIHVGIMSRYQNGNNYYLLEPQFEPAGQFTVALYRQVNGVFLAVQILDPFPPMPTYIAGETVKMRLVTFGTTLLGRVWPVTQPEPSEWHVVGVVADFSSGDVGLRSNLSAGNTNTLPVVITHKDWIITSVDDSWKIDQAFALIADLRTRVEGLE